MIFEYAGRIHDVSVDIPNLTDEQKHWLVYELPSKNAVIGKLRELGYPEMDEWLEMLMQDEDKEKIQQFLGDVIMCCYFLWQTPYGRWKNLPREKYTSKDLAQKVQDYCLKHGCKPEKISSVAWDVAALCCSYRPSNVGWTSYKVYPEFSQTRFPA